jgi:hypothetical protein
MEPHKEKPEATSGESSDKGSNERTMPPSVLEPSEAEAEELLGVAAAPQAGAAEGGNTSKTSKTSQADQKQSEDRSRSRFFVDPNAEPQIRKVNPYRCGFHPDNV